MGALLADAVAVALGTRVERVTPVSGGCISDAGRVELAGGRQVFAKSAAGLPSGLLAVEAEGLRWLGAVPGVSVPEVVSLTAEVLVLQWVEPGSPTADTDGVLGRQLALLHRAGAPSFGWHRDGFIGREPQRNTPVGRDWCTFWLERRIVPLVDRAVERRAVDGRAHRLVDRLRDRLPDLAGPPEPPARVHGDLWSGNVHVGRDGHPWLVDPAAYGGHREVDLAMLHLFGAPGPDVVAAYDEVLPLAEGWRGRLALWQLEPLLNHAVMFGGGYGSSALAILDRFG
ncbi:MAG: fructosamine kinase family protein [Acidimicrobiales bacterium]|nr:fructosamine kinase family protein [Acidimicrobiales bacterium]